MEILARTYRGEVVDLVSYGSLAVVNSKGELLYSAGDPNELAFARSSAKLIQTMLPLYHGLDEKYNLTHEEIAQMSASHSGERIHIETVRGLLRKIGLDETYLKCGSHYPLKEDLATRMKERGDQALSVHNNCSGKHVGMLASAKALGYSLEDYYKPDHPVQVKIGEMIARVCDYPVDKIQIGIDGCGVPVHALPIYNFAYGMARMSDGEGLEEEYAQAAKKISQAISKAPVNASGSDRIDYRLMAKYPGELIVKSGANGYYSGYFPKRSIGFALKIYDGKSDLRNLVVIELLKKLGLIRGKDIEYFDSLYNIDILNHRKEVVGRAEVSFELKKYK